MDRKKYLLYVGVFVAGAIITPLYLKLFNDGDRPEPTADLSLDAAVSAPVNSPTPVTVFEPNDPQAEILKDYSLSGRESNQEIPKSLPQFAMNQPMGSGSASYPALPQTQSSRSLSSPNSNAETVAAPTTIESTNSTTTETGNNQPPSAAQDPEQADRLMQAGNPSLSNTPIGINIDQLEADPQNLEKLVDSFQSLTNYDDSFVTPEQESEMREDTNDDSSGDFLVPSKPDEKEDGEPSGSKKQSHS